MIRGDRKQRAQAYEAAREASWLVVHYDVLSRDEDDLKALFNGSLVVADEAVVPGDGSSMGSRFFIVYEDSTIQADSAGGYTVLGRVTEGPGAGHVVAVRQGNLLATAFHPELTGDLRVHGYFVDLVRAAA